jgi:hypothetical protein
MRVPYADVGPYKVPEGLSDEQVLFLSDIFPTGYMAADFCNEKLEAQIAQLKPGPQMDALRKKIRQLNTASHMSEWLTSPGLQTPT